MVPRLARILLVTLLSLVLTPADAQEALRYVMVTHGAETEPFWATIKQAAERAAEDAGVELEYRAPDSFDLEAMAALVSAAAEEQPSGLIVSIPNADALAAPIRAAVDAGIPVISINSGFDVGQSLGALLHVGQSEYEAGRVAGEEMRNLGGTKALCINHELGNVALDLRCKGFIDGFGGSVEVLPVGTDPAETGTAVGERLAADAEIDVILALNATMGGEPAIEAVNALEEERPIHVGTFDISDRVLTAVADGQASFVIDQQPFLQGYLPVQFLVLLERHGAAPVSNISTGPKLVTREEAARRLGREPGPPPAEATEAPATPEIPAELEGG